MATAFGLTAQNVTPPVMDETITDVNKSASYIFFKRDKSVFLMGLLVSAAWEALMAFVLVSYNNSDQINGYFLLSFFVPLLFFFGIYNNIKNKLHHEFMQQFAQANGYAYRQNDIPQNADGSLFSIGRNPRYQDLITGGYQNKSVALFNYIYVTGNGKSTTTHFDTVFQIEIGSPLPKVLLVTSGFQYSGLVPLFSGLEKLDLEGDFNKYFFVYCKKEFEVEALEIFSPDFMEQTKDNYKEFSIEFVNSRVYIYSSGFIATKDELQKMYTLAQYIISKLDPVLERMKGDISAMNEELKQ